MKEEENTKKQAEDQQQKINHHLIGKRRKGDVKGPLLQKKGERSEKQFLKTLDKKQHEERKQTKKIKRKGQGDRQT